MIARNAYLVAAAVLGALSALTAFAGPLALNVLLAGTCVALAAAIYLTIRDWPQ